MRELPLRTSALALIACAGLLLADTSASAARRQSFDGRWSVTATSQSGPCDPSFRFPISVIGGRVVSQDISGVSGQVTPRGAVTVTVVQGDRYVRGTGRLAGNSGGGRWAARSSSGACTGVWQAVRTG